MDRNAWIADSQIRNVEQRIVPDLKAYPVVIAVLFTQDFARLIVAQHLLNQLQRANANL